MRTKTTLSLLAIVAVVAACSDVSAPSRTMSAGSRPSALNDCSDPDNFCPEGRALPPPPSLDTTARLTDAFGAMLSGAPTLHVTYFMNKTENNGSVKFASSAGVVASPSAQISIKKGSVSGKGTVQIALPGSSLLTIDLANNVNGKTSVFNGDCSKSCGTIVITGATLTPKLGSPTTFNGQLQIAGIIGPE